MADNSDDAKARSLLVLAACPAATTTEPLAVEAQPAAEASDDFDIASAENVEGESELEHQLHVLPSAHRRERRSMLALVEGHVRSRERRYLESAERAFAFHRGHRPPATVDRRIFVFHANWQAQAGALLHEHASSDHDRASVHDHVCSLHDRIAESGFYDRIERSPEDQATVEVACALEGINDAYAIATSAHDADRRAAYARCIRIALAYLLRAQRIEGCTRRERGGFGHSLADRTQRIDVTGHVVAGFIKSLRNQITVQVD